MPPFPQSSILVRTARPEDAFPVAELGSHVFSATQDNSVQPHQLQAYLDEAYSTAAMAADISSPSKDMIVAIDGENGAIIGFALLTRGTSDTCIAHLQNTVELQRLYVHLDFHGKGVGKLMVNRLEHMAKEQGFQYMWLGVWEENRIGIKVYEKLGFTRAGDHAFTIGDVKQNDYVMLKQL